MMQMVSGLAQIVFKARVIYLFTKHLARIPRQKLEDEQEKESENNLGSLKWPEFGTYQAILESSLV